MTTERVKFFYLFSIQLDDSDPVHRSLTALHQCREFTSRNPLSMHRVRHEPEVVLQRLQAEVGLPRTPASARRVCEHSYFEYELEQLHALLRAGSSGLRRRRLGRIVPLNLAVGQGFLQSGDSDGSDFGLSEVERLQALASF